MQLNIYILCTQAVNKVQTAAIDDLDGLTLQTHWNEDKKKDLNCIHFWLRSKDNNKPCGKHIILSFLLKYI